MSNNIYILTVKLPQRTRIQCGCIGELTHAILLHSEATGTFCSFETVSIDKLPKRSEAEMLRGEAFIKAALEAHNAD